MKALLIPLDNRPVSYLLPKEITDINNNIELLLPSREYLGGLKHNSDINRLLEWLEQNINQDMDFIVCCLDTIAYGGLIPSRRDNVDIATVKNRIKKLKAILSKNKGAKIYAFSSIMRISNNNINEEEKAYWDEYGELIFKYSNLFHQIETKKCCFTKLQSDKAKNKIPDEILEDYLNTRQRNFEINKYYLELTEQNIFDYLVFSQDDTAQYGLNVKEAQELKTLLEEKDLKNKVCIKTGADEIPTDLISRGIIEHLQEKISVFPIYSTQNGKNLISRYEDITVEQSTKGQIELCGATIASDINTADIILIIHTPVKEQNDHCMRLYEDENGKNSIEQCISLIKMTNKPISIADIKYANGADSELIEELIKNKLINKLYGYAGWNTTGNTLGSVISTTLLNHIAKSTNSYNEEEYQKALFIRLADDWAYQAIARQKIRDLSNKADIELLKETLLPYLKKLAEELNKDTTNITPSFPWSRTFEVEINI